MMIYRIVQGLRRRALMAGMLLLGSVSAPYVYSQEENSIADIVSERQDGFKEMGKSMKIFRKQLRSDSPDFSLMANAASKITLNAEKLSLWFPVGSGPESTLETDALSYIWKNTTKFEKLSNDLIPASKTLESTLKEGDMAKTKAALKQVGDICSACHDSFRAD